MAGTVLMTIGRMPKGLDLARAFHGAGWRVVAADPHPWHVARLSRAVARSVVVRPPATDAAGWRADISRLAAEERASLVVPVSEETMHAVGLHGLLPEGCTLFAMPAQRVLGLHDKEGFVRVAESYGLAVPRTARLGAPEAAGIAAGAHVVKPRFSCSGRGVVFADAGAPLPDATTHEPAIVQQRIAGEVLSTCAVVRGGRVLVNAIYRGTVMSGSVSVAFRRIEEPAVDAWVARFAAAAQWEGFLSFDFIRDTAGKIWGIECNPRVTSGVHFIDPGALARAILDPRFEGDIPFRPEPELQQFWTTLTEAYAHIASAEARRKNFGALVRARDVTWQARDPLPLLLMPFASARVLVDSLRKKISFGEAATLDLAWKP